MAIPPISWTLQHHDQLDRHWKTQLRPRLEGLTDEEYFWEPVPGCWSVRRRGQSSAPATLGAGEYLFDLSPEDVDPAPVTTIAWRIAHILVGCFVMRLDHPELEGPGVYGNSYRAGYDGYTYAGSAAEALGQLDERYAAWSQAVRGVSEARLTGACEIEDAPLSTLLLHINREVIHHGAEIALLRDLYRAGG